MKAMVKAALRKVAPTWFDSFTAKRGNRHIEKFLRDLGIPELQEEVVAKIGTTVRRGPFTGMQYVAGARGSIFLAKIIGCYEAELYPAFESMLGTPYDTIVDVGCAEGYYAVGLAMKASGTPRVVAYDVDAPARELCARMARENGVAERIDIRERCDPGELNGILSGQSFVLCDCEGYEMDLLDPEAAPALKHAEMLVELHDLFRPGIRETILARFAATHNARLITSEERNPDAYPELTFLPEEKRRLAVSEFRSGEMQWAHLTPHRYAARA
jgi:Ribosomal protein L11 methylase